MTLPSKQKDNELSSKQTARSRLSQLSDLQIEQIAIQQIEKLLHLDNDSLSPLIIKISRHRRALPSYTLDHGDRMKYIENKLSAHLPGGYLVGSYLKPSGMNACVDTAVDVVKKIETIYG